MSIHPQMLAAFQDELQKIAAASEQPQMQSAGPSALVTTSTLDPLNSWDKNADWDKNAPSERKMKAKQPEAKQQSLPAESANKLLFGPQPEQKRPSKMNYDMGSTSALSPDRSQNPVDGQSTANLAAGNMMNPAYGPGGV